MPDETPKQPDELISQAELERIIRNGELLAVGDPEYGTANRGMRIVRELLDARAALAACRAECAAIREALDKAREALCACGPLSLPNWERSMLAMALTHLDAALSSTVGADLLAEREALRNVVARCHEAIGESPASDDATLPDGIKGLHDAIPILSARLARAEAEMEALRKRVAELEEQPRMHHVTYEDGPELTWKQANERLAARLARAEKVVEAAMARRAHEHSCSATGRLWCVTCERLMKNLRAAVDALSAEEKP